MINEHQILVVIKLLIRAIRDGNETLIRALREQTKADLEAKDRSQSVIVAIAEQRSVQQNSQQNKSHHLQKINLGVQIALCAFTALAFGAAAYYACVAKGTLEKISEQTRLMQEEVEAVSGAIVTKEFRASGDERMRVTVLMNNRGKTNATALHADFRLVKFSFANSAPIKNSPDWNFVFSAITMLPDKPIERGIDIALTRTDVDNAKRLQEAIRITGSFSYFDGFSQITDDEVCFYLIGPVEFRNKSGLVSQTMGAASIACDDLPRIRAEYEQTRKNIAAQ
jgi:hypothetical protein